MKTFVSTRTGPVQRATPASQLVRRRHAVRGEEIAEVVDGQVEDAGNLADRDAALVDRAGDDLDEAAGGGRGRRPARLRTTGARGGRVWRPGAGRRPAGGAEGGRG